VCFAGAFSEYRVVASRANRNDQHRSDVQHYDHDQEIEEGQKGGSRSGAYGSNGNRRSRHSYDCQEIAQEQEGRRSCRLWHSKLGKHNGGSSENHGSSRRQHHGSSGFYSGASQQARRGTLCYGTGSQLFHVSACVKQHGAGENYFQSGFVQNCNPRRFRR
jgi:hypothetical protein